MNIYVGNLSFQTDNNGLREAFERHGEVVSAQVIIDRETGRSKGFGFVEMANSDEAQSAIEALDGSEFEGRQIKVNEARPREDRGGRGGGGGGGGGGRDRDRSGGGGGGGRRW